MEHSPAALAQDSLLESPSPPINSFTTRRCRTATPRRGRGSAMSLEKYWSEGENGDLPDVLLRPSSAEPAAKKQRGAQRNSHSGSVKEYIQDMWEKLSLQEMLHSCASCTLMPYTRLGTPVNICSFGRAVMTRIWKKYTTSSYTLVCTFISLDNASPCITSPFSSTMLSSLGANRTSTFSLPEYSCVC